MDVSLDEDEFKFTLFSDIQQNVLAMRENLYEKVSEALREELVAEVASENLIFLNGSSEIDKYDDIPLQSRLKKIAVKKNEENVNKPRTNGRSRRNAKKSKGVQSAEKSTSNTTNNTSEVACRDWDVIELTDSDNEVQICLPNSPKMNKSLNYSIDEITICDDADEDEEEDEDDYRLVSVKINWMNVRVHRFELRKFQKFTTVFEKLAEMENVVKENILLILRDKIFISQEDSPDSLKLSIIDIIEGGITKEKVDNKFKRKCNDSDEKNSMLFKCVLKDRKKPLLVSIKPTDTMKLLMLKASEELECSLDKLKFMFDGEVLDSSARPRDLDLEGGEVFDIHIKP